MKSKRILFIGAHTDDVEFGCGGTISKLSKDNDIYIATFSSCEASVPKGLPSDILKVEFEKSMDLLKPKGFKLFNYPVRRFNEHRQNILEDLIELYINYNPDIIFFHSKNDIHQDHNTIYNEVLRAFLNKNVTLITYEVVKNTTIHNYNLIVPLWKQHVQDKITLIKCYESQSFRGNYEEQIFNTLQYNGMFAKCEYAELFTIIKMIYD